MNLQTVPSITLKEHYFNVEPIKLLIRVDPDHPDYNRDNMVWLEEQKKLRCIMNNMKHDPASDTHYLNVVYKVKEYTNVALGRMYAKTACYQNMYNIVRRLVIDGNLYSLDIENAHPMLLFQLCADADYNAVQLGLYNEKREETLNTLMHHYKISRDLVKNLFVRMCFGGSPYVWSEENKRESVPHPEIVLAFFGELGHIKAVIAKKFPGWQEAYTSGVLEKKNKSLWRQYDTVLAVYLQDLERKCMSVVRAVLKAEGIEIVSLIHDEVLTNAEVVAEVIEKVQKEIVRETGFTLNFSAKPYHATREDKAWLDGHKGVLREDAVGGDDYESVKASFEEEAFKLVKHAEFATWEEGSDLVVQNWSLFKTRYVELKYKKTVYKEGCKPEIKEEPFMPRWYTDSKKRKFHRYDFLPPPMACAENIFNTWSGLQIEKTHFGLSTANTDTLLFDLVKVLTNNEEESYEYVMNWLAHIVQSPGQKCGTALVLKSRVEGAGKGSLVDIMRTILGPQFVGETNDPANDIFGKHGSLHIGKLLVCLDEVKSGDTIKSIGRLRNLITSQTCVHNAKGSALVEVQNHTRFIFTTNESIPVAVNANDRRYCLIECSNILCKDTDFWNQFHAKMKGDRGIILAFYQHLKNRDLSRWRPMELPQTELRGDIIGTSAHPMVFWLDRFIRSLESEVLQIAVKDLHDSYNAYCVQKSIASIPNPIGFGVIFKDKIDLDAAGIVKNKCGGSRGYSINKQKVLGWLADYK
jgi:hypothetical protein